MNKNLLSIINISFLCLAIIYNNEVCVSHVSQHVTHGGMTSAYEN